MSGDQTFRLAWTESGECDKSGMSPSSLGVTGMLSALNELMCHDLGMRGTVDGF
jgi:hypothetical protein